MNDDSKKSSGPPSSESETGCSVTVVKHGPTCPVTQALREVAEQVIGKAGEEADSENAGPAKYNSTAYRNGWDNIFGKKPEVGQA
jgi:hypothetical protein